MSLSPSCSPLYTLQPPEASSLQAQLNKPKLKRILTVLKVATSTYLPAFERLVKV